MKKILFFAALILCVAPCAAFAQWVEEEEDQYDKDYEACSQQAEDKADPLPEDKREDTFVKLFHECMKQKGHDVNLDGEGDAPPPDAEDSGDVGEDSEE